MAKGRRHKRRHRRHASEPDRSVPPDVPVVKKRRRPVPLALRLLVRERDGNICRKCEQPITATRRRTIHHLNGDPGDNRFALDRTDLTKNNLIQWCEQCQRTYHHCEPKPRPPRPRDP